MVRLEIDHRERKPSFSDESEAPVGIDSLHRQGVGVPGTDVQHGIHIQTVFVRPVVDGVDFNENTRFFS